MERKVADAETGSLYGSVSVQDIGDALAEHGYEINRGEIHLDHPIKQLGDTGVQISLAHGVNGHVKVTVVGEDGETAPVASARREPEPVVEAAEEETAEAADQAAAESAETEDDAGEDVAAESAETEAEAESEREYTVEGEV